MRAVIQRVSRAAVSVGGTAVASTGPGLLALVGFSRKDSRTDMDYIAQKMLGMRIFDDESGVMNRSVEEVVGEVLVVSQFTLYGDARRGRRPSYSSAMGPEEAAAMFDEFLRLCSSLYGRVSSGVFRADMNIELVNNGPVTILLDSSRLF
jgi:D-aminoacyl-tRNA deacylase